MSKSWEECDGVCGSRTKHEDECLRGKFKARKPTAQVTAPVTAQVAPATRSIDDATPAEWDAASKAVYAKVAWVPKVGELVCKDGQDDVHQWEVLAIFGDKAWLRWPDTEVTHEDYLCNLRSAPAPKKTVTVYEYSSPTYGGKPFVGWDSDCAVEIRTGRSHTFLEDET